VRRINPSDRNPAKKDTYTYNGKEYTNIASNGERTRTELPLDAARHKRIVGLVIGRTRDTARMALSVDMQQVREQLDKRRAKDGVKTEEIVK